MLEVMLDGDRLLLVVVSRHAIRERLPARLSMLSVPCARQTAARVPGFVDDGGGAAIVLDEELDGPSLPIRRIHARFPFPSLSGTEYRQHHQVSTLFDYMQEAARREEVAIRKRRGHRYGNCETGGAHAAKYSDPNKVAFVNTFAQPGKRIVELSTGIIEGDHVIILNNPLMGHDSLIRKIGRHKRLAFLEVDMLDRKKTVKLGLEIVAKRP